MIEGEFLVADDLGPLGRLVEPGELLVLEGRDLPLIRDELDWIGGKYREADRKAETLRRRMATARLGGRAEVVRELFEIWTVEAAKYALCGRYLVTVAQQLREGKQQAANPAKTFRWADLPQIKDVVQRVISAPDNEIIGGAVFRAG